jgi:hypothetical protein
MKVTGTLAISKSVVPDSGRSIYTVMLLHAGTTEAEAPVHRCSDDPALLRLLEDLVPSPDQRHEALETLRATGQTTIDKVTAAREQLEKFALAPR